jgi:prepilin-type N-terminal cleavage/methylation domain-containing protein
MRRYYARRPVGGAQFLGEAPMSSNPQSIRRSRSGFSLIELVIVMIIMSVIAAMAIPKLSLSQYRSDAAAQQVRSVFQTAQRTSLTRQYDVIVSVDTTQFALRIAEDKNNDGVIQTGEWKFWRPAGEGNRFSVPPKGVNTSTVPTSVVGAALSQVGGLPSITFHRDGSTSSDAEIYVSSTYKGRTDFRAITLTRSTARTELYRLSGTGTTSTWMVVQ